MGKNVGNARHAFRWPPRYRAAGLRASPFHDSKG